MGCCEYFVSILPKFILMLTFNLSYLVIGILLYKAKTNKYAGIIQFET